MCLTSVQLVYTILAQCLSIRALITPKSGWRSWEWPWFPWPMPPWILMLPITTSYSPVVRKTFRFVVTEKSDINSSSLMNSSKHILQMDWLPPYVDYQPPSDHHSSIRILFELFVVSYMFHYFALRIDILRVDPRHQHSTSNATEKPPHTFQQSHYWGFFESRILDLPWCLSLTNRTTGTKFYSLVR